MPKLKTNSSAKKRFRLTGTGKVRRNRAYMRHILTKKSKKRKTRLGPSVIARDTELNRLKKLLNF